MENAYKDLSDACIVFAATMVGVRTAVELEVSDAALLDAMQRRERAYEALSTYFESTELVREGLN